MTCHSCKLPATKRCSVCGESFCDTHAHIHEATFFVTPEEKAVGKMKEINNDPRE